jgi:TetR/AcrR family transcriptional repressor of nem operon
VQHGDQRGCLLCSAAAGPSAVDTDISEVVQVQLRKMRDAFYVALTQSGAYVETGEQYRRNMAGLLLSQYVGLRVMVRSKAPIEAIQDSVHAMNAVVSRRNNL